MGAIRDVTEIVINVRDLAGMKAFYIQTLGFTFHSEFPAENPTIVFLTVCHVDSQLGRGGHPRLFALIDAKRHIYAGGIHRD